MHYRARDCTTVVAVDELAHHIIIVDRRQHVTLDTEEVVLGLIPLLQFFQV